MLCSSASSFAQSSSGSEPKEGSSAPGPLFGGDDTEAHLQDLRDHALSMNLSLTLQRLCSQVLGLLCQAQGSRCSLLCGNSHRGSPGPWQVTVPSPIFHAGSAPPRRGSATGPAHPNAPSWQRRLHFWQLPSLLSPDTAAWQQRGSAGKEDLRREATANRPNPRVTRG